MKTIFTESDITKIASLLQCEWKLRGNNYRLTLEDEAKFPEIAALI